MFNLTTAQLRQALSLREKIDQLESELATLLGSAPTPRQTRKTTHSSSGDETNGKVGKKSKRTMSAAWRAKIAAAARKRWKLARAAGKTTLGG